MSKSNYEISLMCYERAQCCYRFYHTFQKADNSPYNKNEELMLPKHLCLKAKNTAELRIQKFSYHELSTGSSFALLFLSFEFVLLASCSQVIAVQKIVFLAVR